MMPTLTKRFQRARWSSTRKRIDAMEPGQRRYFPRTDYFNCKSSVMRLNDAYEGTRVWQMKVSGDLITIALA
jgi:hypothetical protein